jgi:hypothetical protein
VSFGLQYPRATTQAWLHATLLQWCLVNFLVKPLMIGFFAVVLPKLISGKLRRLRYITCPVGAFQFRTPMRDSAVDYLAARYAHQPTTLPGHAPGAVPPPNVPLLGELLLLGEQREASVWRWPAVCGRARADVAALFSPIFPKGPPSRNHAVRSTQVVPA